MEGESSPFAPVGEAPSLDELATSETPAADDFSAEVSPATPSEPMASPFKAIGESPQPEAAASPFAPVPESITDQTRLVLDKVDQILTANGLNRGFMSAV